MQVEREPGGGSDPCCPARFLGAPPAIPGYVIDPASHLVFLEFLEQPTFQTWVAVMEAVLADPLFARDFAFLFDERRAAGAPGVACVQAEADFYYEHKGQMGHWAFVVSGILAFGMGRMRSELCGGADEVGVFTSMEEARGWLHVCSHAKDRRDTSVFLAPSSARAV